MRRFLSAILFLCMAPAVFANNLRPLTPEEVTEVWQMIYQLPNLSENEFTQQANANLNLEQKIQLLSTIGFYLGYYGYDQSQIGTFPEIPMDQIWTNLQQIIGTGSYVPTAICGGIHQKMALLAIEMGIKAKVFSGRGTSVPGATAHYVCVLETEEYGFVILDYNQSYIVGTLNYDKARTLQQSVAGNLYPYSYVGDPETGKIIAKINTLEGEKMRRDAGEKDVTEMVAKDLSLTETDLRRERENKQSNISQEAGLSEVKTSANFWLWDFLCLKFALSFYWSNSWLDYGAITNGTVLRPGICLEFLGEDYKIKSDLDYSYQRLSIGNWTRDWHLLNLYLEAMKIFRYDSALSFNLTGNIDLIGGLEDYGDDPYMFGDGMLSMGFSSVYDTGTPASVYGGLIITCEQFCGNIQSQNFCLATYMTFIFGTKFDFGVNHHLDISTQMGWDIRAWFLGGKITYENGAAEIKINASCRLEKTEVINYVPDAVKISCGLEKEFFGFLNASISYEGEFKFWSDDTTAKNQITLAITGRF